MNEDFTVTIHYRNKDLEKIGCRTYGFQEYTDMLCLELKRIIMDVEDAFYQMQGEKLKEDWDAEAKEAFNKIRHKLLDKANAIDRLPQTLCYKNIPCSTIKASDMLAEIINNQTK